MRDIDRAGMRANDASRVGSGRLLVRPLLAGVIAVALGLSAGAYAMPAEKAGSGGRSGDHGRPASSPPAAWTREVRRDLAAREYEITWQTQTRLKDLRAAWHAPNRAQGFRTYFTEDGIRVVPRAEETPSWEWGLTLLGYGRGGVMAPAGEATLSPERNRIEYRREGLTEWYVNDAGGLEQGFTIERPPEEMAGGAPEGEAEPDGGPIFVALALGGTLSPAVIEDGRSIDFVTPAGARAIRYAELKVHDAGGTDLPAWMEAFNDSGVRGIWIVVDARDAVYPVTIDPLATSPDWTAESDQDYAYFGSSVATAGDVNGDGYADVIVGAFRFDNGQTDEGRAYLYLGSASGLSTTPGWTAEGDQDSARFGVSVATAGDVNGDGFSDVVVGASRFDNGQTDEGRAYLYLGSASGLPATPGWTAESGQDYASFGNSVATAGDVNGDGYADVVVGASNYDNGQAGEGRAYVYLGSASGLSATSGWTAEGDQDFASFGNSVATAGDVNGDGYADVVVGAPFYSNDQESEGRAYVYLGSASGLSASPGWTAEGDLVSVYFGMSAATAGDVNGDGYADVVVGTPYYDNGEHDEGRAYVYLGSASGLSASPDWTAEGDQDYASFGVSVATAGDVNGDGFSDLIVGASNYDNGQAGEGRAYVYLGSTSGLSASPGWTAESDQVYASFGNPVTTAGDVNGDGFSDVIAGAYLYDNSETNEGRAYVYLGSASGLSTTPGWTAESDQANAALGYSAATAGDVDGDGYADLIVGAPSYDNGQANEGLACVYLGSASGLAPAPAWTAEGNQMDAWFGSSVATAGDVNGDGYADVVVGARFYDNGQANEGQAYVYLGSASGLASSPAWTADSDQASAQFGYSVATAGDVNGDGFSDVVVGARFYDNSETDEGRAYLYLGSASGLSVTPDWTAESDQDSADFGYSVATAGDVNGDGYADVIVGAESFDNDQTNEGRAFVYHGSASGLATAPAWTAEGNQMDAWFGNSVATAGDVNGDGYADVVVGASYYDNGETDEGRAYLYLGSASGLASSPAWTAESDQASAEFGVSVATAGDVNGDGYADVVVGARYYDNSATDEGRAYLYLGSASGLAPSPAWTAESGQASAYSGYSVATAGDVNGDGYADVIVGAYLYNNGQTNEGRIYLFWGNGGHGLSLRPQQRRADDAALIAPSGTADEPFSFRLALDGRTPFGRGLVRLQWEIKPLGTLFDGTATGTSASWSDTGTAGATLNELVSGLGSAEVFHWRVRLLYSSASFPFAARSRWLTIPWNGWEEEDVRTPLVADLSVSQTDAPDPQLAGGPVDYEITVANGGPDPAPVLLTDTLPAGSVFVSATPSQGSCDHSAGTVTCDLGWMASSATATVLLSVQAPPSAGAPVNAATVSFTHPGAELDPIDNSSSEVTTTVVPAIGDRVWNDTDRDGVQDAGEGGAPGVIVALYDGLGYLTALTFTDPNGLYSFPGLTYGDSYSLRFFPTSGFSVTSADQGGDDALDSDADPATGFTPSFSLASMTDLQRWDAGIVPTCWAPDEPIYVYMVRLSTDGNNYPILDFMDANQPEQVTGYNVRRSSNPGLPYPDWPLVATDVVDMDEGTANNQWVDSSGDPPPGGIWYYMVTAYNHHCPAEGPF